METEIYVNGGKLLAFKPVSTHPADANLRVVLVELPSGSPNHKREYVTWIHNTEFDGYSNGNYTLSFEEALADFCMRYAPNHVIEWNRKRER